MVDNTEGMDYRDDDVADNVLPCLQQTYTQERLVYFILRHYFHCYLVLGRRHILRLFTFLFVTIITY